MTDTQVLDRPTELQLSRLDTVGRGIPQIDSALKVTGRSQYTADLTPPPNTLVGKILRSPYGHARVVSVDTEAAWRLPGVKCVLTHADVPRKKFNSFSSGGLPQDEYILNDRARFVGDRIAAVAAVDEETAAAALELIRVEYEPLPLVTSPERGLAPDAPCLHPDHPDGNVVARVTLTQGDIAAGFAHADCIVEGTYKTSPQQHMPLEPHAYLVHWDISDTVTVWMSTQTPSRLRRVLADALGLPLSRVRIIVPYVGGGFGGKNELHFEHVGALLSRATGCPIRMIASRWESMVATSHRHPVTAYLRTGVRRDGTFVARQARYLFDAGAYCTHSPEVAEMAGRLFGQCYRTPYIKYEGMCVYTNNGISGAFRGYGSPQTHFCVESHLDEIAVQLEMDPVELRLKNAIKLGDRQAFTGFTIESNGLAECLKRGAAAIGWHRRDAALSPPDSRYRRGMGMSAMTHFTGCYPLVNEMGTAMLKVNEDGTVDLITSACDVGQGARTVLAQIVAEELGVRLSEVNVSFPDTSVTPYAVGTRGSVVTHDEGMAALLAARSTRAQLAERAARILAVSPEQLSFRDGRVWVQDSDVSPISLRDVAWDSFFGPDPFPILANGVFVSKSAPPPFAAHFAEVEVDTETGAVRVIRLVIAHDVGRAINPLTVRGQLIGGAAQGLGYALMEDLAYDPDTATPRMASVSDYKVVLSAEMPPVQVEIIESHEPTGPFGAKGVGETGLVPVAPAVANAVAHATGVRIRSIPLTMERVWQALREAETVVEKGCRP